VEGTLTRIETQLSRPGFSSGGSVLLTVYTASVGVPNASLGTAMLPWDAIPTTGFGYQSFDVSSFAIPVHVNDVLAFGIKRSGDALFLLRSTFNMSTYNGGETMYRVLSSPPGPRTSFSPSHDSGFKTYVLAAPVGLPGDYNNNGVVDAADYVLWRYNLGAPAGTLPNDTVGGVIGQAQYNTWRANFGAHSGAGSGTVRSAAVAEPTSALMLLTGILAMFFRPRADASSLR
jgi:hypothetical protein